MKNDEKLDYPSLEQWRYKCCKRSEATNQYLNKLDEVLSRY